MPLFSRKPKVAAGDETAIFFATDLHGSEVCFKKFINAASFYKADVLLLGGDISGKMVIPVIEDGAGRYRARLHGQEHLLEAESVSDFERRAWNAGLYTRRMTPEEHTMFAEDPEALERLFSEVVTQTVRRWIDFAHDRLKDTDVVIYNAPGNDDPIEVDAVLQEHGGDRFRFVEGEVIEVAPGHEMLSTGYTNQTPWNTHREYTEEQIAERLRSMTDRLQNPSTALFNIHVPPYNSRLDSAPVLGDDLVVQTSAGTQLTAPVGSTAVRSAIEEVQPLVTLHGHIHESGGATRIGRTLAINAGSEYGEGVLHGVLVTVGGGRLLRHQAVTG
jgi:Icc-related predicted phosphoesterase